MCMQSNIFVVFKWWLRRVTHTRTLVSERTLAFAHQRKGRASNEFMQSSQFWQKKRRNNNNSTSTNSRSSAIVHISDRDVCVLYMALYECSNMKIIFARIEWGRNRQSKRNYLSFSCMRWHMNRAFKYINRASRFACSSRGAPSSIRCDSLLGIFRANLCLKMYPLGKRAGPANKTAQSEHECECERASTANICAFHKKIINFNQKPTRSQHALIENKRHYNSFDMFERVCAVCATRAPATQRNWI